MTGILNHDALEEAIKKTIAEKLSSQTMMKIIEETLDKTVKDAIESALRSYSEAGKAITAAVESALKVDSDLGLPSYNETILRLLRPMVEKHVNKTGQDKLKEEMENLFASAPDEIRLSKLIEEFKEGELHKEEWESGEISLHVEESDYGYTHIHFDKEENQDKYRCDYQIDIDKDGKVYAAQAGRYQGKLDKETPILFGRGYGFQKLLLNLYANGSKLIIDEDHCELSYGPEY
ncbi:hypothetical protein [Pseudovibrio sp. Ad37]|uniref:hypothetical protein n=1 Tax=Pseudovibrio sp. Ad37 TaxID=989422 RepID=UPI0007AE7174|nr:hypothetical protein [Pseudovibrio sp. Ad37]KZL25653.1 hypothetical protein PsAD37_02247 [Pseudovibrio sp. Ad37]